MPVTVIHALGQSFVSCPNTSVKAEGGQVGITIDIIRVSVVSMVLQSYQNYIK